MEHVAGRCFRSVLGFIDFVIIPFTSRATRERAENVAANFLRHYTVLQMNCRVLLFEHSFKCA